MPVSVFGTAMGAGLDQLLRTLVERDMQRKDKEDRKRRVDLDAQGMLERERQYNLHQAQLKSLDEDREERRQLAAEAAEAAGNNRLLDFEAKKQLDTRKQAAIDKFRNAATDDERMDARIELAGLGISTPNPPTPQRPLIVSPGASVLGPDNKPVFTAPNRPTSGGSSGKATPNQIMQAGRNALRDAQIEERNGMLPQGVTAQQRALELREQYLTDLGVDVPPRPVEVPPPVHDPRETASLGTGAITNIPKGPAQPPAAAPQETVMTKPIPGIPGAVAASKDGGKTWVRVK